MPRVPNGEMKRKCGHTVQSLPQHVIFREVYDFAMKHVIQIPKTLEHLMKDCEDCVQWWVKLGPFNGANPYQLWLSWD